MRVKLAIASLALGTVFFFVSRQCEPLILATWAAMERARAPLTLSDHESDSDLRTVFIEPIFAAASTIVYPRVEITAPRTISPGRPGMLTIRIAQSVYVFSSELDNRQVVSDLDTDVERWIADSYTVSIMAPPGIRLSPEVTKSTLAFGEAGEITWRTYLSAERPCECTILIEGLPCQVGDRIQSMLAAAARDNERHQRTYPAYDTRDAPIAAGDELESFRVLPQRTTPAGGVDVSSDGTVSLSVVALTDAGLTAHQSATLELINWCVALVGAVLAFPLWAWFFSDARKRRHAQRRDRRSRSPSHPAGTTNTRAGARPAPMNWGRKKK
jgi:hypothetical protein